MNRSLLGLVAVGCFSVQATAANGRTVLAANDAELRRALAEAEPGTTIRIAAGHYRGGLSSRTLQGKPNRPIILTAADPKHPPVFEGGRHALQLSNATYVEVSHLVVERASDNGLNLDDGGTRTQPAHHVKLRGLTVRDIGPSGNHDGLKLSGLEDFEVEDCTFERWGAGGSGIDMVGCHRGQIVGCTFRFQDQVAASGVQTKGGSRAILIRGCRFEHAGSRAVNVGGSTGLEFFRPEAPGHEAKEITVEDCTFVGSEAPIAFVGVDGAIVRHNTFYGPTKWAFRILQETQKPGFVPSRNGRFTDNLIVYRSTEVGQPINIGPGTAPETFELARNAWYCLDDPARSRPNLPLKETGGVYGTDPQFVNADQSDFRLRPGSPLTAFGARPHPQVSPAPKR